MTRDLSPLHLTDSFAFRPFDRLRTSGIVIGAPLMVSLSNTAAGEGTASLVWSSPYSSTSVLVTSTVA